MDLETTAAEAAPISERLGGELVPKTGPDNDRLCAARWKKWAGLLSKDDPGLINRRLKLAGLESEAARSVLGGMIPAPGGELPRWAQVLQTAAQFPAGEKNESDSTPSWKSFVEPLVQVARNQLRHLFPVTCPLDASLEALATRLSQLASATLDLERSMSALGNPSSRETPAKLSQRWWDEGSIFRDYPALARLLGLMVESWVAATAEFLERLSSDLPQLRETFFSGGDPGPLVTLSSGFSDPHRGGRSVLIAGFSSGASLVYKPRSVSMEAAYAKFVGWLNSNGSPLSMAASATLDRGDYGWMESIAPWECSHANEIPLYFERAGALLALFYVLAGADMHFENMIAQGAHPVPVDLEVLMTPERKLPIFGKNDALREATMSFERSVLTVGLLPGWMQWRKGQVVNVGGLGSREHGGEIRPHQPGFGGKVISSHLHRTEILQGFELMYRFLEDRRDLLMASDSPLDLFCDGVVRFVNRPTALYARALRRGMAPDVLESGATRSMELDVLTKAAIHAEEEVRDEVLALCESEIAALEQGDIPIFQARVDALNLELPDTQRTLPGFFSSTGLDATRRKISLLSPADLESQKKLILLSFDLMGNTVSGAVVEPASNVSPPALDPAAEALTIADLICADVIASDFGVAWIAPQVIPETESFRLAPIGGGLYDGLAGILLFLLATEAICRDARSGQVATRILRSLTESHRSPLVQAMTRQDGIGLGGMGGIVCALLASHHIRPDPALREAAIATASLFGEGRLRRDKGHDIMGGAAGAIPALLALHEETGERRWLDRAILCGDQLLADREKTSAGLRSWPVQGRFLSGYAHGAAGIAASLLRLCRASCEARFSEAAAEAIAYENTLFLLGEKNWRDLRNESGCGLAWCHGAPGIVLGRLQGLEVLDTTALRQDIAAGLETTAQTEKWFPDHACCGLAGRANTLITVSRRLPQPDMLESAHKLLALSADQARRSGGYASYGLLPRSVRGPGFFQGLSGIGYAMLRLQNPSLPDIQGLEISP